MKFYLDSYVLSSCYANWLCIRLAERMGGYRCNRGRRVAAMLAGAAVGLVALAGPFWQLAAKPVGAVVMVLLAMGWRGRMAFRKQLLVLVLGTALLGGGVMLLDLLLFPYSTEAYAYHGGFCTLMLELTASALMITLLYESIRSTLGKERYYYMIKMVRGSRSCELRGMVDSGNELRMPDTGDPVVVADYPSIQALFDEQERRALLALLKSRMPQENKLDFRLLHYATVQGTDGLMPVFRPDEFYLLENGTEKRVENLVVGVCSVPVSGDGHCQILLQMRLLNRNEEGVVL